MSNHTLVDLVLAGAIQDPESAVEDWIARWHESEGDEPLHAILGFSFDEYALYVEKPQFLRAIFMAKRQGIPLSAAIEMADGQSVQLAARGVPSGEVPALRAWLEQTGRL